MACANLGEARNTGPALASRIFSSSSDRILPRVANTSAAPDEPSGAVFMDSLHSARKTKKASRRSAAVS